MDLALNNLQGLICHKIQPTNNTVIANNGYTLSVTIMVVSNAIGDQSSNPELDSLPHALEKGLNPYVLPPSYW